MRQFSRPILATAVVAVMFAATLFVSSCSKTPQPTAASTTGGNFIAEHIAPVDQITFDLFGLPQNYRHLVLMIQGAAYLPNYPQVAWRIHFNGDQVVGNYTWNCVKGQGGLTGNLRGNGEPGILCGLLPSNDPQPVESRPNNGTWQCIIYNYSPMQGNPGPWFKSVVSTGGLTWGPGQEDAFTGVCTGRWLNAYPVQWIRLTVDGGAVFRAGTRVQLYGLD